MHIFVIIFEKKKGFSKKYVFSGDKNLLQSLVLDAMVTESLERHHTRTEDDQ